MSRFSSKKATEAVQTGVKAGVKHGRSAGSTAGHAAADLWEKAVPQLEKAVAVTEAAAVATAAKVGPEVKKLGPGVKKGLAKGLEVAAPKVEEAAGKVSPAVDAARDRIVEDLLPRLVVAANTAAAAAAAAGGAAADAVTPHRRKRKRKVALKVGVVSLVLGAIAAAVTLLRKRSRSIWDEVTELHPNVAPLPDTDGPSQGGMHAVDVPAAAVPLVTAPTGGTDTGAVDVDLTATLVEPVPEELKDVLDDDSLAVPPGMEAEEDVASGDVPGIAEREPDPSADGAHPKPRSRRSS